MKISFSDEKYLKDIAHMPRLESTLDHDLHGFFQYPSKVQTQAVKDIFEKFKYKKHFIHIGIGGSSLGPQLLTASTFNHCSSVHYIDNIDTFLIDKLSHEINLKESVIYVVSKSGNTVETIAILNLLVAKLVSLNITEERLKDFIVVCTTQDKGELWQYVSKLSCSYLTIPENIGGRYSIFTPVGLLPALFAGLDIDQLISGAQHSQRIIESGDILQQCAAHIYLLFTKENINQTVLMPYSSQWKLIAPWFVQLWAESLGKEHKGLTPIPAYGATDQHSQMQLFMEGPRDKLIIIVECHRDYQYSLATPLRFEKSRELNPFYLEQLMDAECNGTIKALAEKNRPYMHWRLTNNSEFNLGYLCHFLQALTAYIGQLIEVNPFDQPGVELGKRYAWHYLK